MRSGEEAMPLTIICPNLKCRGVLQVPESVRGQKVRCGKCGNNLIVPPAATTKPADPKKTEPAAEKTS
jgi:hypothetical protein